MSVKIGSGFSKETQGGQKFISIALDPAILPLEITEIKNLTLWFVPKEERKSEKSPQWRVCIDKYKPDQNNETSGEEENFS